jgi:hypothetical protein
MLIRTKRADAKCRNPNSKFCHCNSSPCDIRDWLVASVGMSNSNLSDWLEAKGAMRRFSMVVRVAAQVRRGLSAVLAEVYGFSAVTILALVTFDNLRHRTPPPVVRDADPYAMNFLYNQ